MAGVLFVNTYNSIVDAPNWCANIPESIQEVRNYYSVADPGKFFRIFSPINQLLALASLIVFWKSDKKIRLFLGLALILAVLSDLFTFGYFYPRNALILTGDINTELNSITSACNQWKLMNWVRSSVILAALAFQFLTYNRLHLIKPVR